jgi:hypothetical protein
MEPNVEFPPFDPTDPKPPPLPPPLPPAPTETCTGTPICTGSDDVVYPPAPPPPPKSPPPPPPPAITKYSTVIGGIIAALPARADLFLVKFMIPEVDNY